MIEGQIAKLERELEAQKTAYEKIATQLPVFTRSINYSTKANPITITYPNNTTFSFDGNERVVVTFSTSRGSNTIADLEITKDGQMIDLKVRRIPYSGGARWIVYTLPNYNGGNRVSTNYNFTVQSAVDGILGARMIWE